ncbi:MAG: hypothetical protein CSB15_00645 [Clostridiales bacterium]|nr:MAG: hypothetical protein CSB15_00645 [Clostridiales bacterium]
MKKNKSSKKIGAILSAVFMCLVFAIYLIYPHIDYIMESKQNLHPIVFISILIGVIFILCIGYVLKCRLSDLDSGLEDDLDKY